MEEYPKPNLHDDSDYLIIYIGTNDFKFQKFLLGIENSIVNIAVSLKSKTFDVTNSNIKRTISLKLYK